MTQSLQTKISLLLTFSLLQGVGKCGPYMLLITFSKFYRGFGCGRIFTSSKPQRRIIAKIFMFHTKNLYMSSKVKYSLDGCTFEMTSVVEMTTAK